MRTSSRIGSVLAMALGFLLVGCGGSGPAGPDEQQESPEPAVLDLSGAAGTWSGWGVITGGGVSTDSWLRISIESSAEEGHEAGRTTVGVVNGEGELIEDCTGDLRAVSAQPPVYHFDLVITGGDGCVGGEIRAQHDVAAGTLLVEFTAETGNFGGSHVVRPGSDPGPPPS